MKVLGVSKRSKGSVVRLQNGDDGPIIEAWTPAEMDAVQAWGGTVPKEFELKDGSKGKILVEPRKGGGGSYSQSKEAFDRSAASREAWQQVEEDRRDRRTALMQAVELATAFIAKEPEPKTGLRPGTVIIQSAQTFYTWLRNPSPPPAAGHGSGPESGGDTTPSVLAPEGPRETEKAPEQPAPAGGPAGAPGGSSSDSPSGSSPRRSTIPANKCDHSVGVDEEGRCMACLKPMGRPA